MRRFGQRSVLELFSMCVATWHFRGLNDRGRFGVHLSPKKKSFVYIGIKKIKIFCLMIIKEYAVVSNIFGDINFCEFSENCSFMDR